MSESSATNANIARPGKHANIANIGQVTVPTVHRLRSHTNSTSTGIQQHHGTHVDVVDQEVSVQATQSAKHTSPTGPSSSGPNQPKRLNSGPPTVLENQAVTNIVTEPTKGENLNKSPFHFWGSLPIALAKDRIKQQQNSVSATPKSQSESTQSQDPIEPMETVAHAETEFQLVQTRKQKRQNSEKSSESDSASSKGQNKKLKSVPDSDDISLFIKGRYDNIGSIIKKNPIRFEKDLIAATGNLANIIPNYQKGYIRVFPHNLSQKNQILAVKNIGEFDIVVSEPYSVKKNTRNDAENTAAEATTAMDTANQIRGVIRGVSLELTESDIADATGAQQVHRINSFKDGSKIVTTTVILTYSQLDKLPEKTKIGLIYYKIVPYVPKPMRCDHCQRLGHTTKRCKSTIVVCSHCSGEHVYSSCPNRAKPPKCHNCGGQHSAAYKKCPSYLQQQDILKLTSKQNITFQKAKELVKSINKTLEANHTKTNQPTVDPSELSETGFRAPLAVKNVKDKKQNAKRSRTSTENSVAASNPTSTLQKSAPAEHLNASSVGGKRKLNVVQTETLGLLCEAIAFLFENRNATTGAANIETTLAEMVAALKRQAAELHRYFSLN